MEAALLGKECCPCSLLNCGNVVFRFGNVAKK
jgi:hypothetical protein